MIEWRWGLAPLTPRDANARNLAEVLQFTTPSLTAPAYTVPPAVGLPCAASTTSGGEEWQALADLATSNGWSLPA